MIRFFSSALLAKASFCQKVFSFLIAIILISFVSENARASCASDRQTIAILYQYCASLSPVSCGNSQSAVFAMFTYPGVTSAGHYTTFSCERTACGTMEPIVSVGSASYSPGCDGNLYPKSNVVDVEKPLCQTGSIIQVGNQTLGEKIPVVGSTFHLSYFTQYVQDREGSYKFSIPVTSTTIDPHVTGYTVTVKTTSGTTVDTATFGSSANQTYNFTWDGLDTSSVSVLGPQKFIIYVSENSTDFTPTVKTPLILGGVKAINLGLGGWLPSVWKYYSSDAETLYSADGSFRKVTAVVDGSYRRVAEEDSSLVHYFDSDGRLVLTKLGLTGATILTFAYDGSGRLSTITEPFSRVTTFNRDISGNLTSIVVPNGKTTVVTLNANGYLETVTNPGSEVYEMTYHGSGGLLATFEKPNGSISSFTYDSNGGLLTDSHSGGSSTTLAAITNGISSTSSLGRVTNFTKSGGSAIRTMTRPNGSTYSREFSTSLDRIIDRSATYQTNMTNDPRFGAQARAITAVSTPGVASRILNYTRNVSLTTPSDPFSINTYTIQEQLGSTTNKFTTVYSGGSNTRVITSPLSRVRTTALDSLERVVSDQIGSYTPVTFTYTNEKMTSIDQGSRNTTLAYNSTSGLLESITNDLGQTTSFTYDSNERLSSKTFPDLRVVNFVYDSEGNLVSLTPPSLPAHTFTIGSRELVTTYSPPTLNSLLDYTTTYSYNNDSQLTQINRPTGQSIAFTYNSTTGMLSTVTAPSGNFTYSYSGGRLSQIQNPSSFKVYYSYQGGEVVNYSLLNATNQTLFRIQKASTNSFGKITSETAFYKNGTSLVTNYTYDADELLTGVGSLVLTRGTTNGEIATATLGVVADTRTFNNFAEMTDYLAVQTSVGDLYEENIVRDDLGRVSQKTVTFQGGTPVVYDYTYDVAGRLTEVKKNSVTDSTYTYDDNSNRNGGSIHGNATTATYNDQDQITAFNAYTYTYNMNGDLATKTNTLTSEVWTYTYDVFGNLTSVVTPTKTITYEIDPLQRRMGKKVNGTLQVRYAYDDRGRLAAELNSSDVVIRRYIYATQSHSPDYYREGSTDYRIIKDHLGSPRLIVNATTGAIVQQMEHDEFGRVLTDTNPGATAIGFAGGLYDVDTGLVRFGARDYDPETGRWTSKDPILFEGDDANLFGYVQNDSVNWVDPEGLERRTGELLDNNPFRGGGAAATVGGRSGTPIEIQAGTNCPGSVGGRSYSGHAFDRMQGRGLTPTAVENTIQIGTSSIQRNGNIQYYDPVNNITVITNSNGGVVTVRPGTPKK